jgi:hypothetical protein
MNNESRWQAFSPRVGNLWRYDKEKGTLFLFLGKVLYFCRGFGCSNGEALDTAAKHWTQQQ